MKIANPIASKAYALDEFLNPDNHITPLVILPDELNPHVAYGVRYHAKLLNFLPLGQVKSIPAYNMIHSAQANGELDQTNTIVEASSGNTSYALAIYAKRAGIAASESYVSHEISQKKLKMLRLFGSAARVFTDPLCADASDPESRIYQAKKAGEENGVFNAGQYDNDENPNAHTRYTAPQIESQLGKVPEIFAAGVGTSGTFSGCSAYFRQKNPNIACVAGLRAENNMVPGLRTQKLMREIAFPWKDHITSIQKVSSRDSYQASLDLIREGIIVGPSSGLSLSSARTYVQSLIDTGVLKKNQKEVIDVVFICCDHPYLYLDEYFSELPDSAFPAVYNSERLLHQSSQTPDGRKQATAIPSLTPEEAYSLVENGSTSLLIDVRSRNKYYDNHASQSVPVPLGELASWLRNNPTDQSLLFICERGNDSQIATQIALSKHQRAFNISGGMHAWRRAALPTLSQCSLTPESKRERTFT